MKIKPDALITATLVVCAVITTGVVVRREFIAPSASSGRAEQKPVLIPRWREHLAKGMRLGPDEAPVQLVEFADFECPYCGDFHNKLRALQERYPNQIALTFVHFPLPGHRFALAAARVVECAGEQGRFEAMYDELFERQDSFGLKPWSDYATAAGVPDLAAFDTCIKKTDPIARVEEGKDLGTKLNIQGTPTIVINGWKLGHPPNADELDGMVKKVLAGKSPVDGKS
jgi:protein-disulfide isomerase